MMFRRALFRLTLTYTLMQLILFGIFAIGVYAFVTGTFDFDAAQHDGEASVNAAEQGFANLRTGLVVGYAILLVLLPLSSYLMARAALAPIRRSYELQQRFVDGASHELRSPLSVVQGELELALTRSRTPAQYRAAMSRALEAAGGLIRLTDDLLLLTRESPGELEASFEPVSLDELVRRVVGLQDTGTARIAVVTSQSVMVFGSRELLARAVANIVDNAVKFTSPADRIEVSVLSSGKSAQVIVRDNGGGMTEAEVGHAFDRFWRAQESRNTPGFGLGLPLVRQVCAAHHGKVTISSAVGVGTTVVLSLPAYQP
ncbi:sensor histidine kinase [Luethyella okanaganae]|uniref:Sensor-like histidine kinase SenX3 n=1 Tax=Luethyella okanaganae TaxID=69372 RepID=A0ABW1VIN3_9MICO